MFSAHFFRLSFAKVFFQWKNRRNFFSLPNKFQYLNHSFDFFYPLIENAWICFVPKPNCNVVFIYWNVLHTYFIKKDYVFQFLDINSITTDDWTQHKQSLIVKIQQIISSKFNPDKSICISHNNKYLIIWYKNITFQVKNSILKHA